MIAFVGTLGVGEGWLRAAARRLWPWRREAVADLAAPGAVEAFRLLFGAAETGVAVLDPEGRLLLANPALRRMAGPAASLLRGTPATSLIVPEGRAAVAAMVAAAGGGAPAGPPVLTRLESPGAEPDAAVELGCEALRHPDGRLGGLLLRATDATARRRLEAQVAQAGKLQSVGQLAGGVAHDFNNLLTAVIGSAEAVLARGTDPATEADLRQILDSAGRGAALVRQLLAFARQQTLQPRVVALNEAVLSVAELLRRLIGERIRLELALEEPGRLVRVDPVQLDQVVLNLAVNARDAMPGGGVLRLATGHATLLRPRMEGTEAIPPGRWVLLEVADTGCGIPAALLPRIFEPFFTTRRDHGGTGLGLATVHGILRQQGGHVTVESRPGEGTRFRLWLPRHDGPAEAATPAAAVAAAPVAAPAAPVLLVEDEAPVRRLAELALRRGGFAVLAVDGAEAALAAVPEDAPPPALLVTDVAMPGMDGLELARRLRLRFAGLPVVLVSGYAEATLGRDLPAEGLRFLAKPYNPKDLVAAVSAAMGASVRGRVC